MGTKDIGNLFVLALEALMEIGRMSKPFQRSRYKVNF
jgi:hypothetical protein